MIFYLSRAVCAGDGSIISSQTVSHTGGWRGGSGTTWTKCALNVAMTRSRTMSASAVESLFQSTRVTSRHLERNHLLLPRQPPPRLELSKNGASGKRVLREA